ncbi:MAG: hypothetical protein RMJ38_03970 [candidate division WOR-3 bacterium]|nr:hypothetical protein [candidate division WOR-3 bacterium]MDW8150578.1 hypothetical protein [candidate division WOR-3 bacterium]
MLFSKLEERYIFGNDDFYRDIFEDASMRKDFIDLVRLSYFIYDNALFVFSMYYGLNKNLNVSYYIDPIHIAVVSSTFNMPAIPLLFYSAISSIVTINTKRIRDRKYNDGSPDSPVNIAYEVIGVFDRNISYDITDLFTSFYSTSTEWQRKLYVYLFTALSGVSIQGLTEKVIFTEFNKSESNGKIAKVFDSIKTLKDIANDKMVLAFAGMTANTITSTEYDHKKADRIKEIPYDDKEKVKKYFNKMLYLMVAEQWNGNIAKDTNLSAYIEELKNPVFNYFGFVIGLTQFTICNPFSTPFFSNVVNCRNGLFSQFLFEWTIRKSMGRDYVLPVNETIIFGPVANYVYARFLDREFNMNINYDVKKPLLNYIEAVESFISKNIKNAVNVVEIFEKELEEKYENLITKHFIPNYLHLGKKSLLSVYSRRVLVDTNQSPDGVSSVVSNLYPAHLSLYTAGITVASSMVYSSLSEMYMFDITSNKETHLTSNAYRIAEDYIYAKVLIPNLLFHWIPTSVLYASNTDDNYKRLVSQDKGLVASLFSPGVKFNFFNPDWNFVDDKLRGSYLIHQLYIDKIEDANTRNVYLDIENARIKLIDEIDRIL